MNLGDGLKLETELLDGKTKLILSPFECKSKNSVKMGNKTKIAKCPLRTKQTGYILKSTQNTCIRSGKLLQKKRMGSETSLAKGQGSLHLNSISNQPEDENVTGVFKKTDALSSVLDENKSVLNKNQETSKQYEQKIAIENVWKPADIFSTLGERERDRSLLEAKKAQWKKELDEQVALKKKEKEASEKWSNPWKKFESDKIVWENFQILDPSKTYASSSSILSQSPSQITVAQADGHPLPRASQILEEALPPERPFSASKQEQQRKWIEDLNKQIEDDRQRKTEGKITSSKGEEHDRWAMHFDSLKNYPASQSQMSSRSPHNQPEYFCVSPDTQELADLHSVYTPTTGSQVEPSEEEHIAKPVRDITTANSQKTNFLRSMTALLDPAQIEERDRRRQKQLEHQKAITAQVEEKRRKKQLEEQQRKKEEEEEERRLAREREEMQKQYEQDVLKQKQKEEIMTLKTNELFQTMQRAQELAQRLKQEQRIRELAQKGHDTSGLIKNLGGHGLDDVSGKKNTCINSTTSPKKDTAVQTDDLNTGTFTSAESCCGTVIEREILNCSSPEIPADFNEQFNTKKDKEELINQVKGTNLEKENSWYNDQCNEFARTEKTHMKKCPKRPDWNINKPLKRYIPASEKYPKQLQKQREEKKVRRQMELLNLVERNNPGHLCQNRGTSPVLPSCQETEPRFRWHLIKKEEEPLKSNAFGKERSQSPPVPVVKNRTQQTQTLKNSNYERENLILEGSQTETLPGPSEPSHFIPYVRTNEIYYLDPDAPLSRPLTQDLQYQNPHDCDQEQRQLFDSDVRDPLLNPNLVKNRDRQQAILKGLSELRQGLLQKQRELETNLMPLAANQEENFNSSF
ncbi:coiled-coil domain-containing protein 66 isoform X8 [Ailuropoda melanoleuca]|uniref:coiled-coil domain-containing protein 66 isoform X8 n=1 Tax=Ailuropoda melanoleuca TaxID=9646 RepID=UPI00059B3FFD|nr:coiled-coil domain-containing protein 66 isoform X8 [Ailuropoda melanoleuca]